MGFLSWPYVEGQSAWGEMTSSARFCELDFYLTSYIAEFINTATSLMYLYLGWHGIKNTKRNGRDKVVILCYAMLASVGPGSMAYHTTIKYSGQMVDEFSMMYATASILYAALSVTLGPEARRFLGISVACIAFSASLLHYCIDYTPGFQGVFGLMVWTVFCQCVWLVSTKVTDRDAVKDMKGLALYGAVTFVGGYVLWRIDNHACGALRSFRDIVGMPLGFVTELHGWWHIFTGLGVYYYVVFIEYLRLYIRAQRQPGGRKTQIVLVWRSTLSLPHIETTKEREE
ncbi:alkaline phytoceramidase [Mollisia scopiformis]|uniref:Alkaline phytoceramidase n=1 Tax=Mollisia scopiformis TaxID=149040 RepID=A0A194XG26_MOLSC|nr:alkaline phytoceramidase [Mollisia scopiformis]KUJ19150.1 alkaline phytoceramidase [Mollisia scopiformis]